MPKSVLVSGLANRFSVLNKFNPVGSEAPDAYLSTPATICCLKAHSKLKVRSSHAIASFNTSFAKSHFDVADGGT
ncbi:Uncharacterised protein [Legionella pneumophila]|nr:Uncharacterised protein [Legionella pneumophila]CZR16509.1 Uncharacterised protein [Legionella pneumophila]CZR23964.1 Uncharacterised protein [Legionella pneumophila]